jgi:hypothetical protein
MTTPAVRPVSASVYGGFESRAGGYTEFPSRVACAGVPLTIQRLPTKFSEAP